jgi:ABC-type transport system substrate-binding protein
MDRKVTRALLSTCKVGLLAVILLLVVAACTTRPATSGTTAEDSPQATATPDAAAIGAVATGAAVSADIEDRDGEDDTAGGKLVRLWADPPTLDPHLTTDATSATIIVEVFGGLVTIDPSLEIVGDLASHWEVLNEGRTYVFHIRSNATFHDGRKVTAQDVKWSMERATDPETLSLVADQYLGDIIGVEAKLEGEANEITGVQVVDDVTIRIDIDAPKSYFLAKLTYPTAFVVDRNQVESDDRWFRRPNATGPFKLASYELGERMVLERHDGYHLGSPRLKTVEFILSGGTAMLMYENDEIHITGVGLADLDRLLDPAEELSSQLRQAPPPFDTRYIGLNVNEPPFDDPKVRLSLNYAIDREEIADIVLGDLVVPAKGILPPNFPGYNTAIGGYEYDPVKARQLLSESKYGDDPDALGLIVLTTSGSFGANVGLDTQVIQEMWRQNLGIEVDVQQTDYAVYLQDLHSRIFQMFEIGWIADYPDPENFLDILFHSESGNNHTGYSNPQVDSLLEQARLGDPEERYAQYHEIERLILAEAPWIPLWHGGEQYILVKPEVKDYHQTPLIIPKLRYVYLEE